MIILIGGIKGGTGKSTLTVNLAAALAAKKSKVLILDCDIKQQTSYKWAQNRQENHIKPEIICIQGSKDIISIVKEFKDSYDYILIDVAGYDSVECRKALTIANVVFSPIRPSQADLDTLIDFTEIVEQARSFNPDLYIEVVLTQAIPNKFGTEVKEAAKLIKENLPLHLCEYIVYSRKVYRDILSEGKSVIDFDTPAKGEINGIVKIIRNRNEAK